MRAWARHVLRLSFEIAATAVPLSVAIIITNSGNRSQS